MSEFKKVRIEGDGTVFGTKITSPDGQPIPGVTAFRIHQRAGHYPRAILVIDNVIVDLVAEVSK